MNNLPKKSGFTVIELLIVMGLFLSVVTLTWLNFTTLPSRITLNTSYLNLLGDIKNQQSLAMNSSSDYGIYISTTYYTLFKGSVYNANDTSNFKIELQNANFVLSTLFPNNTIILKSSSGEINNFDSLNSTITITDNLTGEELILTLNKYAVSI